MQQPDMAPPWWIAAIVTPVVFGVAWLGRKITDALTTTYLADKAAALEERKAAQIAVKEEHDRFITTLESVGTRQQVSMERLWNNQDAFIVEYKKHHAWEEHMEAERAVRDNALLTAINAVTLSAKATADAVAKQLGSTETKDTGR